MPVLQTLISKMPLVGRQGVVYSWPRSVNYLDRPGELDVNEAVDLTDFISGDDGLFVRDGFTQLGSAALDNIALRLSTYEQENLNKSTMAHTKTKLYFLSGTTWTDISRVGGYTGSDDQLYDSCVCLNDYVFTNYVDKIQYWDGVAGTALNLPAAGGGGSLEFTRAKYCAAFAGRLFIANLTEESPTKVRALRVRWSAELVYRASADWTALGSGFVDLAETPDEITGMAKLGNNLVVYKKRSVVVGFETGNINNPFVWQYISVADLDKGTGLVAHQTIANLQGFHLGLFNDNVYRNDGHLIPVGSPVIRDLVKLAGVANLRKSFAAVDPSRSWYILFVALAGQTWPEQGYVYDYRRDLWVGKIKRRTSAAGLNVPTGTTTWASTDPQTWADVDATWGSFGLETDQPILTLGSPDDKKVYQSDSSADYDGAGAEWITRDDDLGAPDFIKTLIRVRMRVDSSSVQPLTLSVSKDTGRSFTQVLVRNTRAVNGEQDLFFDTRVTAERFTLKVSSVQRIRVLEWAPSYQIRERTK